MIRTIKLFMLALLAGIIIACAATPIQESTGEFLDSSVITGKVKARLLDNLGAKGFNINVKTYKQEVQLSGFVHKGKTRERAGVIAASVEGVKQVRNDLIVK